MIITRLFCDFGTGKRYPELIQATGESTDKATPQRNFQHLGLVSFDFKGESEHKSYAFNFILHGSPERACG